ncbi:MAG: transglycosylase domain-containing protein [Erysipelotrichaceae bacterium]|nr:transglycosylase domain-containing protein [Erysipelotrichaceae bacterium]
MKKETELNESQERGINIIKRRALKHREKKDEFTYPGETFYPVRDETYETVDEFVPPVRNEINEEVVTPLVIEDKTAENKETITPIISENKVEETPAPLISETQIREMEKGNRIEETAVPPVTSEPVKEKPVKKKNVLAEKLAKFKEERNARKEKRVQEKIEKERIAAVKTADNAIKNNKPVKEKKEKVKRPKASIPVFLLAILTCIVLFLGICGVIAAGVFAYKLCEDKPTLNVEDLVSPDSTTVYDSDDNKIMELGMYLRENISYTRMPNCLIDAFLAIEDSRFFEHMGFDIPRFTAAAIANFRTRDFSQGGSTVTMQLIKNTYYSIDADDQSTIAARSGMSGIKRKMQEIVLSLELENIVKTPKQEILAMYINKVNYGNNIRGVEKAAQYYFGKSAENLNLPEAAFLAGLINSPNTYNPYNDLYKEDNYYLDPDINYLQNAYDRRDEVLDLMVMHGYISETEANLAKSVRMEDLLSGISDNFAETNDKYQDYIDAVIDEVIETTGESPYEVGMEIHTNMNAYMQEYLYDMQNEEEYVGLEFPNELCQSAVVVMDNQNGAIEALGGGRGETESARQFNRATSAYLNPGSSIKPVIDYALCIDKLGYATSHTFTDQPYYLYDGNVLISNYDHRYYGDMLMTEALGRSQNTPAVQALAAVVDEIGEEAVVDYMNSIGFKFDYADFDLQFAIGGNRCLVTPLQLAGAHAMFINGGRYIKPHTVNYIVYNDKTRDNFVADTQGTQAISKETAWMVAYLERYNMIGDFSSLMWYCKRGRDYPLYGKTGTTDWGDAGLDYGIPEGSTKDSWLVMQTNKYTISCWTGYDKLEKGAYFTQAEYQENTKSQIVSLLLDELETHHLGEYDPYTPLEKPDTVVEITHVKGAYPYAEPGGGYMTVTGYISKQALDKKPLVSVNEALETARNTKKYISGGIGGLNGSYDGSTVFVTFGAYGGANDFCVGEACDLSSTNAYDETTYATGRIWFPHWTAIYSGGANPPYIYTITSDTGEVITGATDELAFSEGIGGSKVTACVMPAGVTSQACITIAAG